MSILQNKKLLIGLAIFVGAIILIPMFFFLAKKNGILSNLTPYPTNVLTHNTVTLSFQPTILKATNNTTISANLFYDTGKFGSDGIIVNLYYDPKKVTNVTLTQYKDPTSALSNSFDIASGLTTKDPVKGTLSETFSLKPGIPMQKGRGIIAKFSATVLNSPATIIIDPSSTAATNAQGQVLDLQRVNLEITSQ